MIKKRVAEAAAPYVQYDMIHKHTELPKFAEPRLHLLLQSLRSIQVSNDRSERLQLVTALVQLGMDTHDYVDTESGQRTEQQMRSRQLKILAGDYFSARFYQLLAKAGEIELVGVLSKAVADVNRLKISFYEKVQNATVSAEEYLKSRIQLKSEMFYPFSRFFDEPVAKCWVELLESVSSFEVLYEELEDTHNAGGYAKSMAYWHLTNMITSIEDKEVLKQSDFEQLIEKYQIRQLLLDKLFTVYEGFKHLIENDHCVKLKIDLQELLDDMSYKVEKFSMKRVEAQ